MSLSDLQIASFVIGLLCLLLAWPIGVFENQRLRDSHPESKPFAWGYTFSYAILLSAIVLGLFVLISFLGGEIRYRAENYAVLELVGCLLSGWISFYAIRRRRWALVVVTILSLSIWYWVINFFYLRNRWEELAPSNQESLNNVLKATSKGSHWISALRERYAQLDVYQRLSISGGTVWIVVSFLYFISFDEFDTSRERSSAMFLMFVPPLLALTLRTLYLRETKRAKDK